MDEIVNHKEAFEFACHSRDTSNLARCYIEVCAMLDTARLATAKLTAKEIEGGFPAVVSEWVRGTTLMKGK